MHFRLLLIAGLLLSVYTSYAQEKQEKEKVTPKGEYSLLWEISGKGLKKPSYVFGTMHINDSRVFEFSDSVLLKFDACEGFASEIHPDSLSGGRFSYMYYEDQPISIRKLLGDTVRHGIPELQFQQPYLLRSFYARAAQYDIDKPVFLDAYLFNLAKRQGKVVSEVELIEEHVNLVNLYGNAWSKFGGFKFKFDFFGNEDQTDEFINTYRSGNIKAIDSAMNAGWHNRRYIFHLLDKRNFVMARRMDSLAHVRPTFFAVGAAHLPGKNGVVQLLKNKGFNVRRVTATFKGMRDSYVPQEKPLAWTTISQDIHGYNIQLPGNIYRDYETQDTFRVHTFIDLGTNSIYNTFCIDYSKHKNETNGKDLTRKVIISVLESGDKDLKEEFKVVSKKEITHQSVKGTEVVIKGNIYRGFAWRYHKKKEDIDTIYIRLQIWDHQDRVYVNRFAGTKEQINGADAEKFFQSISFYKPAPYKPFKLFTVNDTEAGFSVGFEKPALRNEALSIENPDDTSSYSKTTIYYINTNLIDEKYTSYVMYDDHFVKEHENTPDSLLLKNLIKENGGYYFYDSQDSLIKNIEVDGIKGLEYTSKQTYYGQPFKIQCFLRGNRAYVVYFSTTEEDTTLRPQQERFFNSFHFTKFKNSSLKKYENATDSISFAMPGKVFYERDTLEEMNNYGAKTISYYSTIDPANGGYYYVYVSHISKYTKIDSLEQILNRGIYKLLYTGDSIAETKDFKHDQITGKEYTIKTSGAVYAGCRSFIAGNRYYRLYYRIPVESGQKNGEEFLRSFQTTRSVANQHLTDSKSEIIIRDIFSNDSLTRIEAIAALDVYKFENSDADLLNAALIKTLEVNDSVYRDLFIQHIFKGLASASNERTIELLDSLYNDMYLSAFQKMDLLAILIANGSDKAIENFMTILKKEKYSTLEAAVIEQFDDSYQYDAYYDDYLQELYDEYDISVTTSTEKKIIMIPYRSRFGSDLSQILYNFYDSIPVFKKHFAKLAEYSDPSFHQEILGICDFLLELDSLEETVSFFTPHQDLIYKNCSDYIGQFKKAQKTYYKYDQIASCLYYYTRLINILPAGKNKSSYLTRLTTVKHDKVKAEAFYSLIHNDYKINQSSLEELFKAESGYCLDLIKRLKKEDKMQQLPAAYLNHRSISTISLKYYLNQMHEMYDSLVFDREKEIIYKGVTYKIFVYHFKREYDAKGWAIVLQPKDEKEYFLEGPLATTVYYYGRYTKSYFEEEINKTAKRLLKDREEFNALKK